jgi:hypothetical protein
MRRLTRRNFIVLLAVVRVLLAGSPAAAQQAAAHLTAEQRDIGKVETRILKYDQAIGVVTALSRPSRSNVECGGSCYFPSSTKSISWQCEPDRRCSLHCTVNPPVGGCD